MRSGVRLSLDNATHAARATTVGDQIGAKQLAGHGLGIAIEEADGKRLVATAHRLSAPLDSR